MTVLWPCRKSGVSQCPGRHNKAKLKSAACMSDHKLDEVPVACTDEMHRVEKLWDQLMASEKPLTG